MKAKTNNGKIRLSYSLIDAWKRGKREEVVDLYLHVDNKKPSKAMLRGIEFDRMTKDIAIREHRLPDEFGSIKLTGEVIANQKYIVEYGNFYLSAELDLRTPEEIIELKCSEIMDSADYLTTLQLPFYLFVAHLLEQTPKRGMIYRYDPAKRIYDVSIMYPNERVYAMVQNAIDTYGEQIERFFKEEGVI